MDKKPSDFQKIADTQPQGNLLTEFWGFLRTNRKWWLLPIVIVLALMAVLLLLSGTGLAPFIYTLF
jgi:hypothetical protein